MVETNATSNGQVYKAQMEMDGLAGIKSFFPSDWTQEKVVEKIIEASEHLICPIQIKKDRSKILYGKISEGIIIEIRLNCAGEVVIAFPKVIKGAS